MPRGTDTAPPPTARRSAFIGPIGITSLRESLGGDVQRIYEHIDALLDSEDGLLVLFDGGRMVSYTQAEQIRLAA